MPSESDVEKRRVCAKSLSTDCYSHRIVGQRVASPNGVALKVEEVGVGPQRLLFLPHRLKEDDIG